MSHDIFEGIIPETLSCCLTKLINEDYLSIDKLNQCIDIFQYLYLDITKVTFNNRNVQIKSNQSEMWCFYVCYHLLLVN